MLKRAKGFKKNELVSLTGFGEIFYNGRQGRSVFLIKTSKNGGLRGQVEVPLEWVELISDNEGDSPISKSVLK